MKYLGAAFLVKIGNVPVNVLAVVLLLVMSAQRPLVLLIGLVVEVAFLMLLATNRRFQVAVDAMERAKGEELTDKREQELVMQLPGQAQRRYANLEAKCQRILEINQNAGAEPFTIATNREALAKLRWLFLKLLIARVHLGSTDMQDTEAILRSQIAALEGELAEKEMSPALWESKTATLQIAQKRLQNIGRRAQALEEMESDLARISAEVELVLENASMNGKPEAISVNIDLASHLLENGYFGEAESAVADIDSVFAKRTPESPTGR